MTYRSIANATSVRTATKGMTLSAKSGPCWLHNDAIMQIATTP